MILDINTPYSEIKSVFEARMEKHISLVNQYYKLITGTELKSNHDSDKYNSEIWKYYYYCREKHLELPPELYLEWKLADEQHRLNSNHHIECLVKGNELDWCELVSDFFAVSKKHNRDSMYVLNNVYMNYKYAKDYIEEYIDLYDEIKCI